MPIRSKPDMSVTVNGTHQLAEAACRQVFGTDANLGPVRPAPEPLLELISDWPVAGDMPVKVALHLPPMSFDLERELGRNQVQGVALIVNRVSILHQGKLVGYAIRTDDLGLAAIDVYERAWAAQHQRLRNAH